MYQKILKKTVDLFQRILNKIVDFVKKNTIVVIIAFVVVVVAFLIVSELTRKQSPTPVPQISDEGVESVEAEVIPIEEPRESPPPPQPSKTKETTQQTQAVERPDTRETSKADTQTREIEKLKQEIQELQKKMEEIQDRIAELREEEKKRAEARSQVLQMLESHANQVEHLGNTLRQVFKTPAQIRIIATDLKNQAGGLRAQIQSEGRAVGSSSIDREVWALKRTVMVQRAADLEALALDLQRTGGEPAKVRIIGIRIQDKAREVQRTIQSKKSERIPPNTELLRLEEQLETGQNRIQELQRQQQEMVSQ